jgi:hypothetical protein
MDKIIELTPTTKIYQRDGACLSLLIEENNKIFSLTYFEKKQFDNWEDAIISLSENNKFSVENALNRVEEIIYEIKGFPVKHEKYSEQDSATYPVYLVGKNKIYAAGWWSVNLGSRWTSTLCPSLKTLEQYPNSGPFKTRVESSNDCKMKNNYD